MQSGLNSHYFHTIGDKLINPIVGVYIPIIRIPIKGGMTVPQKKRLLTMAHIIRFECFLGIDPGQLPAGNNGCLVQMIFLFKGVFFFGSMLIFRGVYDHERKPCITTK